MDTIQVSKSEQWRETVKGRAKYLREKIADTKLFGEEFKMNDMDAVLVAVFLLGVKEGSENFQKVLASMPDPHKATDDVVKKYKK